MVFSRRKLFGMLMRKILI